MYARTGAFSVLTGNHLQLWSLGTICLPLLHHRVDLGWRLFVYTRLKYMFKAEEGETVAGVPVQPIFSPVFSSGMCTYIQFKRYVKLGCSEWCNITAFFAKKVALFIWAFRVYTLCVNRILYLGVDWTATLYEYWLSMHYIWKINE